MGEPHVLVVSIDDDCIATYDIECPHEGPDRPCGTYMEKDWPDAITCRCAEIGDGTQCEGCAEGYHDECAWGTHINDVGPSCRAEPIDECWYAHAVREAGQEMLDFGRSRFQFRFPVELSGAGWDEAIEVSMVGPRGGRAHSKKVRQPRIKISTYGGGETVQHWTLHFDGEFLADTSAPHHVAKWEELKKAVDGD